MEHLPSLLRVRLPDLREHAMTDLQFHISNCTACQRGLACLTRQMISSLRAALAGWWQ
ncbi:hypothetical protein [Nocardiopsis sp. NRRL B-16309]|uniref:hypothetical protein n=1 Tax=Nocardiopsis sp. NRRL B-16309 TaxID=1519494 RepID=UPI000B051C9E|nr:hypothetical protein [Nocardiopsis sp. NRRL B-16309]